MNRMMSRRGGGGGGRGGREKHKILGVFLNLVGLASHEKSVCHDDWVSVCLPARPRLIFGDYLLKRRLCRVISPWYDLRGWLGVKNQLSILYGIIALIIMTFAVDWALKTNYLSIFVYMYGINLLQDLHFQFQFRRPWLDCDKVTWVSDYSKSESCVFSLRSYPPPRCDLRGWLGAKNQVSIYLSIFLRSYPIELKLWLVSAWMGNSISTMREILFFSWILACVRANIIDAFPLCSRPR